MAVNNPYGGGQLSGRSTLLSGSTTTLLGKPQQLTLAGTDYPLVCRGGPGMSTVANARLTLNFTDPHHRASDGLAARQCSFMDRALRPNEPLNVQILFSQASFATHGARTMDGPTTYTLYVHNWKNTTFLADRVVKGFPPAR